MRKLLIGTFVSVLLIAYPKSVQAFDGAEGDGFNAEALCLPGVYINDNSSECLVLGSAEYQTTRAGVELSIATLPDRYLATDENYGKSDNKYIWLDKDANLKIYYSLDKAIYSETSDGNFPGGFSFATFQYREDIGGKSYYLLENGTWIKGADVLREVSPTPFRGVITNGLTPVRPFGWVLYPAETFKGPGWASPKSGNSLTRYDVIEVFDTVNYQGYDWYQIGIDEWVDQRWVALVFPNETPPEGVKNSRWIELNLFEQTTAVYENSKLVFATLTTSGSDRYFTRPGLFKITEKVETTSMGGGVEDNGSDRYYLQGVPWSMYFDEARAFHGQYWHDHLGYQSSRGCANLSFADAEWMYNWAEVGDWVYVWDPSGQTPVEEHLFTQLIDD